MNELYARQQDELDRLRGVGVWHACKACGSDLGDVEKDWNDDEWWHPDCRAAWAAFDEWWHYGACNDE